MSPRFKIACHFSIIFLVLVSLVLFSGLGLRRINASLGRMVEGEAVSIRNLAEIRKDLRDTGFRLASFAVGIEPAAETRAKLTEARTRVRDRWRDYRDATEPGASRPLDESMRDSGLFFDEFDRILAQGDSKAAAVLIRSGWPRIQNSLLAPLDELHARHGEVLAAEYRSARGMERGMLMQESVILALGTLLILMGAFHMRRMAMEYQRQVERSVAASKMSTLGEMASGIAHEINNPLAVIHGRAGQLRDMADQGNLDPAMVAKISERIEQTVTRIAKIVRGLRTFAREGENDPFTQATLGSIIDETLELCRERFRNHGVRIDVAPFPQELSLECRSTQIAQVLLNLLNNSFDAVRAHEDRWVRIGVEADDRYVFVRVTDSGTGIPRDLRGKIMQPFFTTKGIGAGTGLGLSISQGIVRDHLGELWLDESDPNTSFVVRVPLTRSADRKAA